MSGRQQKEIQSLRAQLLAVQPLLDIVQSGKLEVIRETIEIAQYSGPIPDPGTLAKYEELSPGFAADLRSNYLAESEHRRARERDDQIFAHRMFNRQSWLPYLGMLGGYGAMACLVWLAWFLASRGNTWECVGVLGGLAGLVAAFILGGRGIRAETRQAPSPERPPGD